MLYQRIGIFTNLPLSSLDRLSLQKRLDDIGRTQGQRRSRRDERRRPLAQRLRGRSPRHGIPARDRHRLRHHGRAAGGRQRAIALLGNTLPTGAILVVLITMLGPDLGRPLQSGRDARIRAAAAKCASRRRSLRRSRSLPARSVGVFAAHLMFDLPLCCRSRPSCAPGPRKVLGVRGDLRPDR